MSKKLPFLNFSLKKVLDSESDSFAKAKIKIVVTILIFSLVKAFIVVPFALADSQYMQFLRAGLVCVFFLVLIMLLLSRPSAIGFISHWIVISGLGVIYSNLFVYIQHINILTMQLVFMVTLTSYYLIGGWRAACYTATGIVPVLFFLFTKNQSALHLDILPQELAATAFETIVLLNFITFVLVHYLYYKAFYQNLKEKDTLNQQLQINIAEVKALADSRTLFLSTMSHELRTPLNGVIGMAHLIRDTASTAQVENLDILDFSANHLLSVINDILDFNKSELNRIDLESLPVNLYGLINKISDGLDLKVIEKNLRLKVEVDEHLKTAVVMTDPTRLTQIIYNLAGNAIKFTPEGTVGIKLEVLDTGAETVRIKFIISDTGIGIAEERQAAIFDPFTQASADTTRHYGGTGLGLAIVKKLLALFGSNIWLESTAGKGSTFIFIIEFPLYHGEINAYPAKMIMPMSLEGIKVLIADDNQINVLLLERLLSRWGIEVVIAENGQEAVEKVTNETFDLVLMDLHMPVMDGCDATQAIRSITDPVRAKIPVIALTASVSDDVYHKIKDAGMQDYLAKPFQADHLLEKLQNILKPVS